VDAPSLLLAAFPPELAGLEQDPPAGWQVACTGIGALAASVATARLLAAGPCRRVLFVGTCGAYDGRLPLGALLAVREAIDVSLEECRGQAFRPPAARTRWPATLPLPWPAHDVAVPPAITATREGASLLGAMASAEHLELTGVFAACHDAGVPCGALLAVANRVGPDAHGEWLARHARASQDLVRALKESGVL
jgi:purine-nucleoside phosphorylase